MKRNGLEAINFNQKMNYNRNTNAECTTETIMFHTRCYNQYGKLPQMIDWKTEQKLLKMCGGNFKIEYLYIKIKL